MIIQSTLFSQPKYGDILIPQQIKLRLYFNLKNSVHSQEFEPLVVLFSYTWCMMNDDAHVYEHVYENKKGRRRKWPRKQPQASRNLRRGCMTGETAWSTSKRKALRKAQCFGHCPMQGFMWIVVQLFCTKTISQSTLQGPLIVDCLSLIDGKKHRRTLYHGISGQWPMQFGLGSRTKWSVRPCLCDLPEAPTSTKLRKEKKAACAATGTLGDRLCETGKPQR